MNCSPRHRSNRIRVKRNEFLAEAQEILMDKLPFVPVVEEQAAVRHAEQAEGTLLYPHQNLIWRHLHE